MRTHILLAQQNIDQCEDSYNKAMLNLKMDSSDDDIKAIKRYVCALILKLSAYNAALGGE